VRLIHWLLSGALTLAVLVPGRLRDEEGIALARRVGLLSLLMVLVCPVCHLHYLSLAVPLVAVLVVEEREAPVRAGVFLVVFLALGAPMLPGLGVLRDLGVPLWAALALGYLGWCAPGTKPIAFGGRAILPAVEVWGKKSKIREAASCSGAKCDLRLG
jgi:hypothetical protein